MSLFRHCHFSVFPHPEKDYIGKSKQMEQEQGNRGWKERQCRNESRRLLINGQHRMNIWFCLFLCFSLSKKTQNNIVQLYGWTNNMQDMDSAAMRRINVRGNIKTPEFSMSPWLRQKPFHVKDLFQITAFQFVLCSNLNPLNVSLT